VALAATILSRDAAAVGRRPIVTGRRPPAVGRKDTAVSPSQPRMSVVLAAWTVVLALSLLPTVIAQEVLGRTVTADLKAGSSVVLIAAGFIVTMGWKPMRALRPLLLLFLVLLGAQWFVFTQVARLPIFRTWLDDPSFGVYMPAELLLNLMVTLAVIVLLAILKRDRRTFFLAKGDLSAPAQPIRWLRVKPGDRWNALGRDLTVFISLGTLAFLVLSGQPSTDIVVRALPFLPAILLAAALNAFNEEVTYKASFLSVLVAPVGSRQALRMVAAYFGIAHFYGIPYGVIGVILAWFLGWILARSMLETRGLTWAWFIHFVQDVLIFGFLAIGAITPGGS
jgi:Type II CAAX prenyl endopeptidase Rce1-like